ncbi:MAG TPA: hypothetical protein VHN98_04555, partial [Acidimicrobiales bacterium]|nr:hypothetical protein [Acidimicrobiales bacterium]
RRAGHVDRRHGRSRSEAGADEGSRHQGRSGAIHREHGSEEGGRAVAGGEEGRGRKSAGYQEGPGDVTTRLSPAVMLARGARA